MFAVIGVAGLWLAGGKKSEYSAAIQIDSEPQRVFLFLVEPDKLKSWVNGLTHVERLELVKDENGRPRRSITARVISTNGQEKRFDDEVIRYEQDKSVTVQSSNTNQVITSIFQLEPRGNETYLKYRVTVVYRGIGRFFAPLRDESMQGQMDQDIGALKNLVESRQLQPNG